MFHVSEFKRVTERRHDGNVGVVFKSYALLFGVIVGRRPKRVEVAIGIVEAHVPYPFVPAACGVVEVATYVKPMVGRQPKVVGLRVLQGFSCHRLSQ